MNEMTYHNHQAGIDSEPIITDNGNGTLSVATTEARFFTDATRETIENVVIAGGSILTPTSDIDNFLCADRNTADWVILNSIDSIDYIRYVPYYVVVKRT